MSTITAVTGLATCLWFDDQARHAAEFYTSLLPDSLITGSSPGGPDGEPLVVEFTLAGVPYTGLNGGPHFTLNEAVSLQVTLPDQATADLLWDTLVAEGEESQCGWLKDKYGLSWQVIPDGLVEALSGGTPEENQRATQAMLGMRRLDLAAIQAARNA
ncbi:MAG: VOC family protein [Nocardioides sp.]